ncbi:hypothetical protein ACIQOV_19880 [Kitasatospora sp. NPDC091257]|uniref:hypothetical protein n=1 Tax=Kitasatospora sp. NPDC091257 TaxID=3364084 RepID=UPI00380661F4
MPARSTANTHPPATSAYNWVRRPADRASAVRPALPLTENQLAVVPNATHLFE